LVHLFASDYTNELSQSYNLVRQLACIIILMFMIISTLVNSHIMFTQEVV